MIIAVNFPHWLHIARYAIKTLRLFLKTYGNEVVHETNCTTFVILLNVHSETLSK